MKEKLAILISVQYSSKALFENSNSVAMWLGFWLRVLVAGTGREGIHIINHRAKLLTILLYR